jgi:hypothetical protein
MSNPSEQQPGGEMGRGSNPFRSEDDTARMVLGCIQLFTFAIAILLLVMVTA